MVRILKTAFNPPTPAHAIRRETLLQKIRQQKGKRLVLLKAGPGFGKTVLAAHFCAEVEQAIWISIPKGYFSFFDLLTHLVYALHEKLQTAESEELLEYCHLLQTEELIMQIFKLMTDQVQGELFLFLDDVHHLIFLEATKEKMLEIFFSFLPAHVQVIFTSHEDLPFPTSPLLQSGEFFQIEEQEFAFTLHETRELLRKNGFEVTSGDLHRIDQISHGWISVIILLMNELQGEELDWSSVLARVQTTAGNYIEHFIANLPLDLQSFLTEISIFEFVDAAICDRYLQRHDSQEQLNRLLALNFVYQMENGLFGMHQLVREPLAAKLDPARLPDKYAHLATVALEAQNQKAAIMYLLKAGQYLEAVQQMLKFNDDRVRDIMLMQHWLELIPESYFAANPLLYFYRGQVLERITHFPEALRDYLQAEELCQGKVDLETQHIIRANIIGLYWHRREFPRVIEMCHQLLSETAETEYKTLSIVYNLLGTALIEQLERVLGVQYLKKALENCRLSGIRSQEAWILNNLCFWEYIPSGDLVKAVAGYEEGLAIFQAEQAVRGKTLIYLNLGNLYLRMGEVKKASMMFDEAERINIRMKNFNGMTSLYILQARAEVLGHNLKRAEEILQQIPDPSGLHDFLKTQTYLTYSYLYTARGDLQQALHWAEEAWNVTSFQKNYLSMEFLLQKIKVYYLLQEYSRALGVVAEVKEAASKWGYVLYQTEALFFECAITQQLGALDHHSLKQFVFNVEQKEMYFLWNKYRFLTELLETVLQQNFKNGKHPGKYGVRAQTAQTSSPALVTGESWSMGALEFNLFGEFAIQRGADVITAEDWTNKKAMNLLKYLILNRGEWLHQSKIFEIFWPELEMTRARQNCYVAVGIIRKMLEPGLKNPKDSQYLFLREGFYTFDPKVPFTLDVEGFTQCCLEAQALNRQQREADAEVKCWEAKSLYRTGLLPENLYDDWSKEHRQALQNTYCSMMLTLLSFVRRKNSAQALELAEELLLLDPFQEAANLTLLELLAAAGNLKGVLAHFQKLKSLYWTELNMAVPETVCAVVRKYTDSEIR